MLHRILFVIMLFSVYMFLVFFFFKQKTAYEMRISDWSSDVCSSDLPTTSSVRRCRPHPCSAAASTSGTEKFSSRSWLAPSALVQRLEDHLGAVGRPGVGGDAVNILGGATDAGLGQVDAAGGGAQHRGRAVILDDEPRTERRVPDRHPAAGLVAGFACTPEVAVGLPPVHLPPAARAAAGGRESDGAITRDEPRLAQSAFRSEEHTSELQSLMRTSYAVFSLN